MNINRLRISSEIKGFTFDTAVLEVRSKVKTKRGSCLTRLLARWCPAVATAGRVVTAATEEPPFALDSMPEISVHLQRPARLCRSGLHVASSSTFHYGYTFSYRYCGLRW